MFFFFKNSSEVDISPPPTRVQIVEWIGFIGHLQVVITNSYNIIANFYTLQITTAHAKTFQSAVSSPTVSW
jgi:hypothetical protein